MNRIYKVIWNEALNCFTAVGEYAKAHGKSSKSSVSSNATINTTSNLSSINTLRLSTIGLGLLAAGFVVQTNAEVSYSNLINITGHQSQGNGHDTHGNGNGYGHETHGNGNGYGHNEDGNNGNNGFGLKFAGDTGGTIIRNQGDTLNIKGGETNASKLTSGNNIGVVSNGTNTLTIKLAKDLTGLNSASFNNGVVISATGINAGNKVISGVANGVAGNDAVNVNQLATSIATNKTKYYSVNSTATGNSNNDGATGPNAMAMGGNATAAGGQAIAIGSGQSGQNTTASGQQSIAIGANVVSKGHSSIALGGDDLDDASKTNIGSNSASATLNGGTVNTAFNSYAGKNLVEPNRYDVNTESGGAASIAMGVKALSKGDLSTAVGVHASSAGTASSAFGMAASATKQGSLALGAGAKSDVQDGVALGSRSVANVAGGATGFVPAGTLTIDENAIIATRSVALGAVSVGTGAQGGNRQIVNVAAGTNDSDAVNVAQLVGLQNGINGTLNQGIDFGGDSGTNVNRKLGEKLLLKGGETDATKLSSGNNIGVVADGNDTLTVKLAKDLTGLDSVTTGNSLLNTNGLSITGGPTFTATGINANNQQIQGVASGGTTVSNAANIGDVNTAITGVTNLGFGLKAADGNTVQKPLGQAVEIVG
ncbi:ESPR-type extended signal peptide-containing protein, partial [Psychrobacter alimentarius]|uniref:ESPR-type extended signal peptide-containing protein n=1 Tax=Psychrobacter alimentarius TaxID=261164 RepID=UPI00191A3951